MTINEIQEEVSQFRVFSRRHIVRLVNKLNIKPVGIRQNPNHFPNDTGRAVIGLLGLDKLGKRNDMVSLKQLKGVKKGGAK